MNPAAFYCVADETYFLGVAALINSLRLHGHCEPVHVLDRGLRPEQRELLAPHAALLAADPDQPPWLQKAIAPLAHPSETMVLIDADMIATRSLADLIDRAADGRAIAFANDTDRWDERWGELLGLGPLERRTYLSSGLVVLGGEFGARILGSLDRHQGAVEPRRTFAGTNDPGYPFRYPEQDVLNAILAAEPERDRIVTLPNSLAANPPYAGLRITDLAGARCAYADGTEPFVLHQFVRKPWLEPMYHGIYPRLFARLLLGEGLAIRVPESWVPRRMRAGAMARLERTAVNAVDLGRWYVGERFPAWLRRTARRDA
jgi:lipopolysaccharide biosynthesis glycosyltransferase